MSEKIETTGYGNLDEALARIPSRQEIMDTLNEEQAILMENLVNNALKKIDSARLGETIIVPIDTKLSDENVALIVKRFQKMGWKAEHFVSNGRDDSNNLVIYVEK